MLSLGGVRASGQACLSVNLLDTIPLQCIRKVTSHESQSGSRKFNLREPLFCYGSHYKVSQNMGNFVEFTRTFTRITHKPVPV